MFSRLVFHHFPEITHLFGEMVRVLKQGGRLVLIDMAAAGETLRENAVERLRDPSHVKNLSVKEMRGLYDSAHLTLSCCEETDIHVSQSAWMELTKTFVEIRGSVSREMAADISGGAQTGFYSCLHNGDIYFDQRWQLLIGAK